jgi:hypothetical protein
MQSIIITLDEIVCTRTSDGGITDDEIYVIYQADAGHPFRIPRRGNGVQPMNSSGSTGPSDPTQTRQTWQIGHRMKFSRDLLITLYDEDIKFDPAFSDYLVSQDYTPDYLPVSISLTNANGAAYTLKITVNG